MQINKIGNYDSPKPSFNAVRLETHGMVEEELNLVANCLPTIAKISENEIYYGGKVDFYIAKAPKKDAEGRKIPNSQSLTMLATKVVEKMDDIIDFDSKLAQGGLIGDSVISPDFYDLPFNEQVKFFITLALKQKRDFLAKNK